MKKSRFNLSLCFLIFASTLSNAFGDSIISPDNTNKNSFLVQMDFNEETDITVLLTGEFGKELSKRKFSNVTSFVKRYKLLDFEDGKYSLIVKSNNKTTIQTIGVVDNKIEVIEDYRNYFTPKIEINNSKLSLNMAAMTDRNINFQIIDNFGDLIYSSELVGGRINKVYDLNALPRGSYFVRMTNSDIDFTYNFKK